MSQKTLEERIDAEIASLQVEKERIRTQADADLVTVADKIAVLKKAKAAITKEVEAAFVAVKAAGFIKEL